MLAGKNIEGEGAKILFFDRRLGSRTVWNNDEIEYDQDRRPYVVRQKCTGRYDHWMVPYDSFTTDKIEIAVLAPSSSVKMSQEGKFTGCCFFGFAYYSELFHRQLQDRITLRITPNIKTWERP